MDRSTILNFQPGHLPVDQKLRHQQQKQQNQNYQTRIPEQTTTSPSVSHNALQDDFSLYNPCSVIQNWPSTSPESVAPSQHPWGLGMSQGYTTLCSSPFLSQNLPFCAGDDVHSFSIFDAHNHDAAGMSIPMTTGPGTNPVKLELQPLEVCSGLSLDEARGVDTNATFELDSESFYPSPASQESHTLPESSSPAQTTCQIPSPPLSLDLSSDQRSPTPVEAEESHGDGQFSPCDKGKKTKVYPRTNFKRSDIPYSGLIEAALRQTAGNKLSLQGIYKWFRENTLKGHDKSKGWQNSIRHNLSMNAAFVAVREKSPDGSNLWRLTSHAFKYGVESTTRYRKQTNQRKGLTSEAPAPRRQQSGAKCGKITKNTVKSREKSDDANDLPAQGRPSAPSITPQRQRQRQRVQHQQQEKKHEEGELQQQGQGQKQGQQHGQELPNELYRQRYAPCPTMATAEPELGPAASTGGLSNVFGCADPPWETPVFGGMGNGSECLSLDIGAWCEMYSTYHSPSHSGLPNELPNGLPQNSGWTTPAISRDFPLGI